MSENAIRHRLSPPSAFLDLHALLRDASLDLPTCVDAMMRLPDLSAEVLRVANSPVFGLERSIDRLDRAIALVGTTALADLTLRMGMGRSTRVVPDVGGVLTPDRLRADLPAVARVAVQVARCANVPLEEEARTAGLLHDIGVLELAQRDPVALRAAHEEAAFLGHSVLAHEREAFGTDHAELGREILDEWGLPETIVQAVAWHHTPLLAPPGARFLPCIVAVAESLCETGGAQMPALPMAAILEVLDLSVADWNGIAPRLLAFAHPA